jgi:STAS domain-containing protein
LANTVTRRQMRLPQDLREIPKLSNAEWFPTGSFARNLADATGPRRVVRPEPLRINSITHDNVATVVPSGVLDLYSYAQVRTALVKHALEVPRALIVDLGQLVVPDDSSFAVFTSAWMEVSDWPGVPIHLVTADDAIDARLRRNGIVRHIPVHATVEEAIARLDHPPPMRRAICTISCSDVNGTRTRRFVERTCRRWSCSAKTIADASQLTALLVAGALDHEPGDVRIRLELRSGRLAIVVQDTNPAQAGSRHTARRPNIPAVEALAHSWGRSGAHSSGMIFWATVRT